MAIQTPSHPAFEIVRSQDIKELNTHATLYRHRKTGAQLLSLINNDENKVFGINFYTPPVDSTGLTHILEHSVLAGSRKYPVRDPFREIGKGSLNTFVNAFTYPDKTCYPVASQNLQDFYNLIDVYLDSVLYPLLLPETLETQGWHFDMEAPGSPLIFKGVVFNEMKGAYSSPEDVLEECTKRAIYPDTFYAYDSGGNPQVIPDLTYAQFKHYWETYYHPSNAMIWFYGDDAPAERLSLIDKWLSDFEPRQIARTIPEPERFHEPRRMVYEYAATAEEEDTESNQHMLDMGWLLPLDLSDEEELGFSILNHILLGTPASPLYRALIESGLGEEVLGGLASHMTPMTFNVGLKGATAESSDAIEALILDTLQTLAQGLDPETILASMNTVEFQLREQNTGSYPRGIALMVSVLPEWVFGSDPIEALCFEASIGSIKDRLQRQDPFFESLITKYLNSNAHRATILLKPDPTLQARMDEREQDRLAKAREQLTPAQLQAIYDHARALDTQQNTPDKPEDLAKIPTLKLTDLDQKIRTIPLVVEHVGETPLLAHDLFTNGIAYLDLAFNLHLLPVELLPYVELFSRAVLEFGTTSQDFVQLAQRIGQKTGGIRSSNFISMAYQQGATAQAHMMLRAKGTVVQVDDLLAILREVLLTVNFDQKERFRQFLMEEKASSEARLIPSGHIVVLNRLLQSANEADWANDQVSGIANLQFVRRLVDQLDAEWPNIVAALKQIRAVLVNRQALVVNVTIDAANYAKIRPAISTFVESLPSVPVVAQTWTRPTASVQGEGLILPTQVNFVGKGGNLFDQGYTLHGSYMAINNLLSSDFMWDRIRTQGGAYGGFVVFNGFTGMFTYLSYRDPNISKTLAAYDSAPTYLRQLELPRSEVDRAIIGAIGELDTYQLPDAKGYTSLVRYLIGNTDVLRQQRRDELLATTLEDFHHFGDYLARLVDSSRVVVLGSPDAVASANEELKAGWQITKLM